MCGLTPPAYWGLSNGEFLALIDAKKKVDDVASARHMNVLRMIRIVATFIYNANSKNQKSPKDLLPFPSELPEKELSDPKKLAEERKRLEETGFDPRKILERLNSGKE
jgi:hypothetical protein